MHLLCKRNPKDLEVTRLTLDRQHLRSAALATLMLASSPSFAAGQPAATASKCRVADIGTGQLLMTCDVTNHSKTAIASIEVEAIVRQTDRAAPWVDEGGTRPGAMPLGKSIAGGIEPGETIPVTFMLASALSKRADKSKLRSTMIVIQAYDVNRHAIK